jgi:hypothetical protein
LSVNTVQDKSKVVNSFGRPSMQSSRIL